MAHYPSSAELAAFRRSIAYNRDGQTHATALAFGHVPEVSGIPTTHPYELQRGIGYRIVPLPSPEWNEDPHASRHTIARREASAMRSRAYAAEASFRILAGDPGWSAAPSYIIPDYWDDEAPRTPLPVRYGRSFSIVADAS